MSIFQNGQSSLGWGLELCPVCEGVQGPEPLGHLLEAEWPHLDLSSRWHAGAARGSLKCHNAMPICYI